MDEKCRERSIDGHQDSFTILNKFRERVTIEESLREQEYENKKIIVIKDNESKDPPHLHLPSQVRWYELTLDKGF